MKAIIITDAESLALLDSLELESLKENHRLDTTKQSMVEAHRLFHYVVCRWLQSVGAETVRR